MLWLLLSLNLSAFVNFSVDNNYPYILQGKIHSTNLHNNVDEFFPNSKETDAIVAWLTEQDHDFGELRQGRPAAFTFKFRNIASDTIVLQTVRTSCGCTAARYTEEPVAPGATGEITVEYDAYQSGVFSKKIKVFFDKQKKAETLWIRGEVN